MDDKTEVLLDSYLVDLNQLSFLKLDFDNMSGRNYIKDILKGSVPEYDSNNNYCNFPELSRSNIPGVHTKSSAFLFAGEEGNGKRTLDRAYLYYLYNFYEDVSMEEGVNVKDYFRYFKIQSSDLSGDSKCKTNNLIRNLFDNILELCEKDENDSVMIFISLGNITKLISHKKTAGILGEKIEKILSSEKATCIITACYSGLAKELPDSIKSSFMVFQLDEPDKMERTDYFEMMRGNRKKIIWKKTLAEMAKDTENFTFQMLKQVCNMIYMLARSKIFNGHMELESYVYDKESLSPIIISEEEIDMIISNVKKQIGVKEIQNIPVRYEPQEPIMWKSSFQNEKDEKQKISVEKEDINEPDTTKEIIDIKARLRTPSGYTPEDFDKERAKREQQEIIN